LKSQLQEVGKFWVHLRLGAALGSNCLPVAGLLLTAAPGRRPQLADSVLHRFCGKLVFGEYLTWILFYF
jgi:hypothetical protein